MHRAGHRLRGAPERDGRVGGWRTFLRHAGGPSLVRGNKSTREQIALCSRVGCAGLHTPTLPFNPDLIHEVALLYHRATPEEVESSGDENRTRTRRRLGFGPRFGDR